MKYQSIDVLIFYIYKLDRNGNFLGKTKGHYSSMHMYTQKHTSHKTYVYILELKYARPKRR